MERKENRFPQRRSDHMAGCRLLHGWLALAGLLFLLNFVQPCWAQIGSNAGDPFGLGGTGTLVVSVRGPHGTLLPSMATVNVYTPRHQLVGAATVSEGSVRFPDLLLGPYTVEAVCPGYETVSEEIELLVKHDQKRVSLSLRPLSSISVTRVAAAPPLLAPRVQKELKNALDDINAKRYEDAQKNLSKA